MRKNRKIEENIKNFLEIIKLSMTHVIDRSKRRRIEE
jgi:hypothetical protein